MQSKRSVFNPTLYRKNLTGCWPLWTVAALIACNLPMAGQMLLLDQQTTAAEAERWIWGVVHSNPIIALIYGSICAAVTWRYLYQTRYVNQMHAFPIRRESIFLTDVLSGLTIMLIPYAAGVLFGQLVLLLNGFTLYGVMLKAFAIMAAQAVFYFGVGTLCAFLTGHGVAFAVFYYVMNFLAVLTESLMTGYASGLIFGCSNAYKGRLEFLSPTVYMMNRMQVEQGVLQRPGLAFVYGLVGLLLLAGACLLYRGRRSETAGDVVAVKPLYPVFRYGVALYFGLTIGRALYYLVFDRMTYSLFYRLLPISLCVVCMGVVGYFGASMLLDKSFRVFTRKGLTGAAAVGLAGLLLCLGLRFGTGSIVSRVPEQTEIRAAAVYLDGCGTSYLKAGRDDAAIEEVLKTHQSITDAHSRFEQIDWTGEVWAQEMNVDYLLQDGTILSRQYTLLTDGSRKEDGVSPEYRVEALKEDKAIRMAQYFLNDPDAMISSIEVDAWEKDVYFGLLEEDELEGFAQAFAADAEEYWEHMDADSETIAYVNYVLSGDAEMLMGERESGILYLSEESAPTVMAYLTELGYLK